MAIDAKHVVHISLTEGMDPIGPFGVSILELILKTSQTKRTVRRSQLLYTECIEHLKDVCFIDVGNMPPHKARQYLEQVKYEVQQKRVPNKKTDGTSVADSSI